MRKARKTIYKVTQSLWGTDRSMDLYFETRREAEDFHSLHDYSDAPQGLTCNEANANQLLRFTRCVLAMGAIHNADE